MKRTMWMCLLAAMLFCACGWPPPPTPMPLPTATLRPAAPPTAVPTPVPAATATPIPSPTAMVEPTASPSPAATRTSAAGPTATPGAGTYDGDWVGLTALGQPVSFRVKDNLVIRFSAEYDAGDCHVKVDPDLAAYGSIENGSFSMSSGLSALLGYRWHFAGTFVSPSQASGEFSGFLGSCGSVDTTWEASRE